MKDFYYIVKAGEPIEYLGEFRDVASANSQANQKASFYNLYRSAECPSKVLNVGNSPNDILQNRHCDLQLVAVNGVIKHEGGVRKKAYKRSSKKVKVGKAERCVYVGPRGGEYVKVKGEFVSVKKASPKK